MDLVDGSKLTKAERLQRWPFLWERYLQQREEDFWTSVKVGKTKECWEWQLGRNDRDYGVFRFHVNGRIERYAHRVAWILFHRRDPEDLLILHKCDNPPCCNPKHLYVGTHKDNAADMIERGRRQANPQAGRPGFLGAERAATLKERLLTGDNPTKVAHEFGISLSYAYRIKAGKAWKNL